MAYRNVDGAGLAKALLQQGLRQKMKLRSGFSPDNLTRPRPLRHCDNPSHWRREPERRSGFG
jgi:hypothetical protein